MTSTATYTLFNGESIDPDTLQYIKTGTGFGLRPASTTGESFSRLGKALTALTVVTAQAVYVAVPVIRGQVITNLDFWSDSTAAGTPTHALAGVYTAALAQLATSVDGLTTAWAANTKRRFVMTVPYTVDDEDFVYAALAQVATTPATVVGLTQNAVLAAVDPAVSFTDTGHTISTALPATATKSAGFGAVYVAVS